MSVSVYDSNPSSFVPLISPLVFIFLSRVAQHFHVLICLIVSQMVNASQSNFSFRLFCLTNYFWLITFSTQSVLLFEDLMSARVKVMMCSVVCQLFYFSQSVFASVS